MAVAKRQGREKPAKIEHVCLVCVCVFSVCVCVCV